MMRFLRSQSQTVLFLILIVLGGSFLFYGNVGSLVTGSGGRGNDFGKIDGDDVAVADLYDSVRMKRNEVLLSGHPEQLSQPGVHAELAKAAWERLLLLHEADRLHVQVTDKEVIDNIQHQPDFQKNGVFDPDLYQKVIAQVTERLHISPDAFATYVRQRLIIEAVGRVLFSTVRTPSGDVAADYDKFEGQTHVSMVTLDPRMMAAAQKVTPDQIQAEYKANPLNPDYRTAEQRKIDYVLLSLTPEQMKLPAKEKGAAIEALGEKALDFALALQPDPSSTTAHPAVAPDFASEAAKRGFTVSTTDFFAVDAPPAGLPASPNFNNAAFTLTKEAPVSKVVELDNGVALLHLHDVQPSELKPLAEVKSQIIQKLQQTSANQQAMVMGQIISKVLQDAVSKGADFKAAAAAQKLTVETMPPFVMEKVSPEDPRLGAIAYASLQLPVGGVSSAVPLQSNNTVIIVHVDKRDAPDPAGLPAFEDRIRERHDEQVRELVSSDWVEWMNHRRGTHPPPDLEQFGGVE